MAAVIDFDSGFRKSAIATIDAGLTTIETAVGTLGPTDAVTQLQRAQRRLAAQEHQILAAHVHDNGNTRDAQSILRGAGTGSKASRAAARKKLNRAKAVGKNADLAKKLADDEIGEEQLDLIADAAEKSNGEAATDQDLINNIAGANPDEGRRIKDDWLANRATKDGTQTEHDRQRALRRTQTFTSKKTGLDATLLEGDGITQRAIRDAIRARSKEIFKRDGGRDLPNHLHPRTRAQREYDAAYELLCGVTTRADGTTVNRNTDVEADTHVSETTTRDTEDRRSSRPAIVISLTVDHLIGNDPAQVARQIGLGVIPDSILADYAEHADIFTALFDRNGEPLWLARLRRNATPTQYIALVLRDRGCVQCGAHATECDVHHRIPWSSPAKGETNLNNLVLLCRHCHTQLHANQQTLYRDTTTRHWKTRLATPNETPPPRPKPPPPQRE